MAAKTEFFFRKTEVEYELVVKYLENLGYWENLLLFWMMVNKASFYLILWVMIFTQEKTPQQTSLTYLLRLRNSNTRKRRKICSELTIITLQRCSTVFIINFEYISFLFIPFSSVSAVGFEQVNVCWVSLYQFINVEITYCCKY